MVFSSAEKCDAVRAQPLFQDLPPAALDPLCRSARVVRSGRGETIFLKGDPATSLFIVIDGAVRASSVSTGGRTAMLNLIGKGEIFGEVAALDGLSRTTDAIAHCDSVLLSIDRRELLDLIGVQPQLMMKFVVLLCGRVRATSEQVERLMLQSMPARLAGTIIRLAESGSDGSLLRIEMTQQQVSEMAGMSRETVNKLLASWTTQGWIRLGPRALNVVEPEALRAVAGEG
jgi:CRP-like cAMP-binding protein